ncbi:hypothetical protein STEG23_010218, partial [Scotinomys teguina]
MRAPEPLRPDPRSPRPRPVGLEFDQVRTHAGPVHATTAAEYDSLIQKDVSTYFALWLCIMDTKEEKKEQKERKQSYFARLKKKKQAKQNAEIISSSATKIHSGKEDANSVILEQDKSNIAVEGEHSTDEKKKRKNNQLKEIRRTELKRYYSIDDHWLGYLGHLI